MNPRKLQSACLILASAGLVFMPMGCKKAPPVTLTATAAPPAVYSGEPVTVTATAGSLSTKKNVKAVYTWSGTDVTGNGSTATVDTTTLAPGPYTVNAKVEEFRGCGLGWFCSDRTQHEVAGRSAEATATYTVKPLEPPTVGCSASPSTIQPGETSTITAVGVSPQNRTLTYSYSAASGTISGNGATAEFNSAGAPAGPVAITCNVADDKNQTGTADTTVTIEAPYVAPVTHVQALSALSFEKERPTRVDNEAKAILDEIALDLQKQPDAKLVLVGEASAKERATTAREEKMAMHHHHVKAEDFAAQRAVNAKAYLVTEKGIDASRISVATGTADSQTVEEYLVPAGADFTADVQGTTPVDESVVKPQERKPLGMRHAHKHMHKMAADTTTMEPQK
jgi:outer membrane protein OmpA-like peptidoglycan-associated protein